MRLATLFLFVLPALAGGDERSPFEMVRFKGEDPQVQLKSKWFEFVSLDGVPKDRIIACAKAMDPSTLKNKRTFHISHAASIKIMAAHQPRC